MGGVKYAMRDEEEEILQYLQYFHLLRFAPVLTLHLNTYTNKIAQLFLEYETLKVIVQICACVSWRDHSPLPVLLTLNRTPTC